MARAAVKFDELLDAFEYVSFDLLGEHSAYLCVETGKIRFEADDGVAGEDEDEEEEGEGDTTADNLYDEEKYISIPHKNDLDLGVQLVMEFTAESLPDALGEVEAIFRRRGAYSRFKDFLEARGMLQKWYDYEEKRTREALREWCDDMGIELLD
jgi:hypothetical protein